MLNQKKLKKINMINPENFTTVNITVKVKNKYITKLENYIKESHSLISFEHLQDTSNMYEKDPVFKKMVKDIKKLKDSKLDYVIKNNSRYNG